MKSDDANENVRKENASGRRRVTKVKKKVTFKRIETPGRTYIQRVTIKRVTRVERTIADLQRDETTRGPADASAPSTMAGSSESFDRLPQQWKLSLRGVRWADGRSADELNGDYILDRIYADTVAARWEHVFPARVGLYRAALAMTLARDGILLEAGLSGLTDGPGWSGTVRALDQEAILGFQQHQRSDGFELKWPSQIRLVPILSMTRYPAGFAEFTAESFHRGGDATLGSAG